MKLRLLCGAAVVQVDVVSVVLGGSVSVTLLPLLLCKPALKRFLVTAQVLRKCKGCCWYATGLVLVLVPVLVVLLCHCCASWSFLC